MRDKGRDVYACPMGERLKSTHAFSPAKFAEPCHGRCKLVAIRHGLTASGFSSRRHGAQSRQGRSSVSRSISRLRRYGGHR